jgi:hypothetical protein
MAVMAKPSVSFSSFTSTFESASVWRRISRDYEDAVTFRLSLFSRGDIVY